MRFLILGVAVLGALALAGPAVRADAGEAVPGGILDRMQTDTAPGLGAYGAPFFDEGTYRDDVRPPSDFLGRPLGSRPASYDEALAYFEYLDENFSNASLTRYGRTYEGRTLFFLTVTSEAHAADLDAIRERIGKLADPRKLSGDAEARKIIGTTPAVAWMAYGIHGDELSSGDAAVQLAYQLIAGTDETSRKIREEVVVCIDPMQNPDGRMRWLKQMEQFNSVLTNRDIQSLHHRGFWPWGRGNHYYFDLNRDWFAQVHPESRGRIPAILEWNPQFMLDCHEMGPLDTYLFSPPREPFNPYMISQIHKWWKIFADDQGAAFDRHGWEYYTREWNEELFPGYGSSWGIYIGAIGMLYEQAGVDGSQVRRRDGTVMAYRETVHHQFTSSMANLTTVADHRKELLEDYYKEKKRAVGGAGKRRSGRSAAFVLPPSPNRSRMDRFVESLERQRIEVSVARVPFKISRAKSALGARIKNKTMPKGSIIIRVNQPMRALIETILSFDVRLPTHFLEAERKEKLKRNRSKLYETTAWSMPLAYNLECYYTESLGGVAATDYSPKRPAGGIIGRSPRTGYAVDNTDDRSYILLGRLFQAGDRVWGARKPFRAQGRTFPPGSFLIKRTSNPGLDEANLEALARETGVDVYGVNTSLGGELADLGGDEFVLLRAPRIGLVGGPSVATTAFGAAWHLLDSRMAYPVSTLDAAGLGGFDLRKYNVLILPRGFGPQRMKGLIGKGGVKKLKDWVRDGGTLIATGNAAAFLADSSVAISSVRPRRQVLKKLAQYDSWLEWADEAESPKVDSLAVWENGTGKKDGEKSGAPKKRDIDALKREDALARRLGPQGAILAADLDGEHWLAFGERSPLPVMFSGSYAYLSKRGVEVPARLAPAERLRVSGLLWPEARERWGRTDYATRERHGHGQVILFAATPNFRAYFHGGERLLQNAIFLGPGFGTSAPLDW